MTLMIRRIGNVNPFVVIKRYGITGTIVRLAKFIGREAATAGYYRFKYRKAERFQNPTPEELNRIEKSLNRDGIATADFYVDLDDLKLFKSRLPFPDDYHGGINSGVRDEKILEHYISYKLLSLEDFGKEDIYVDVAACSSPWAQILREKVGIKSYAIDADLSERYRHLDYYMHENATSTSFPDSSVRGLSLQCAYEMFVGDDDIGLLKEMKRILRPGGKAVIVPLYMHTHYCSFSSPEYWGKGCSDKEAKEYVNITDWGTPSARFYDVIKLREQVLNNIARLGMTYKMHVLRNKEAISPEVYCHFILEVVK